MCKLVITFPCAIKQTGDREVEVMARPVDGPVLHQEAMLLIAPCLSDQEKDRLADDIIEYAMSEGFKRSLRVVPVH